MLNVNIEHVCVIDRGSLMQVPLFHRQKESPEQLKQLILNDLRTPVLFKGFISSWKLPLSWTPQKICQLLGSRTTKFKLSPKRDSDAFKEQFLDKETVFENRCHYEECSFEDFKEWMENNESGELPETAQGLTSTEETYQDSTLPPSKKKRLCSNPLMRFPSSQYWIYADYKYMSQLCEDLVEPVDWSVFGFEGRNGIESTLWIGSEGAYTPCHYDTYGCNLVAQLSGKKRWLLFAPSDSKNLYPTRIPYEESSVFSEVNISCPDLNRHPLYESVNRYEVCLERGDVLFVPRHWWHYVECVEPAVSVNTWIEVPEDSRERVKEGVARTLVSLVADSCELDQMSCFLNPNEVLFSFKDNLEFLSTACDQEREQPSVREKDSIVKDVKSSVGVEQLIDSLTSDDVLELVASKLCCTIK